jgi:hypothetical protein
MSQTSAASAPDTGDFALVARQIRRKCQRAGNSFTRAGFSEGNISISLPKGYETRAHGKNRKSNV